MELTVENSQAHVKALLLNYSTSFFKFRLNSRELALNWLTMLTITLPSKRCTLCMWGIGSHDTMIHNLMLMLWPLLGTYYLKLLSHHFLNLPHGIWTTGIQTWSKLCCTLVPFFPFSYYKWIFLEGGGGALWNCACFRSSVLLVFSLQIFRPSDLLAEGRDFNSVMVTIQLLYNIAVGMHKISCLYCLWVTCD